MRAVVLVSGRAAVALPCSGGSARRSFAAADEAWGMRADQPTTVGVYLTAGPSASATDLGSPAVRGHADLKVYSRSSVTPPVPDPPVLAGVHRTDAARVVLGGLARPVTADFGTRTFTVVPGSWHIQVNDGCSTSAGSD